MNKKLAIKIGAWVGELALSYGVGYAWGTLLKKTIGKWFEDEERMEAHPVITTLMVILYLLLLMAMPFVWAFGVTRWINNKIDEFLDRTEESDEKDDFED